jgi:hypothetical protein
MQNAQKRERGQRDLLMQKQATQKKKEKNQT